jgi:hypothetical protein
MNVEIIKKNIIYVGILINRMFDRNIKYQEFGMFYEIRGILLDTFHW